VRGGTLFDGSRVTLIDGRSSAFSGRGSVAVWKAPWLFDGRTFPHRDRPPASLVELRSFPVSVSPVPLSVWETETAVDRSVPLLGVFGGAFLDEVAQDCDQGLRSHPALFAERGYTHGLPARSQRVEHALADAAWALLRRRRLDDGESGRITEQAQVKVPVQGV